MKFLELKVPPVMVLIVFVFAMTGVSAAVPAGQFSIPGAEWLLMGFMAVGMMVTLLGIEALGKARTTLDPRFPDKAEQLVVSGVYRISRNPIYLGLFLMLVSLAVYLSNTVAFLLLPLFIIYMNYFQIMPEEKFMSEKFGEAFHEYKVLVRRWI